MMRANAIYSGTLRLKALAERRFAECVQHDRPDEAAVWTETVRYFEQQLDRLHLRLKNESVPVWARPETQNLRGGI